MRARIGELLPGGQDKWWDIQPDADPARVIEEVKDAVKGFAVPWLESMSDPRRARAKVDAAVAVAFALALGDKAGGLRLLRELVHDAKLHHSVKAASLSEWLARLERRG